MGQKEDCGRHRDAFVKHLQSLNNSITESQAVEFYNVLDAVQALLAIPRGQRIVIDKTEHGAVN